MNNVLAVDLGTAQDFTAFSLLTRHRDFRKKKSPPGTMEWKLENQPIINEMHLKFLERPKQNTPYPAIIQRTREIMENPKLAHDTFLIVDATGVGLPVLQMMIDEGLSPIGITITSGHNVNKTDYGFTVPKRDLVTSLQCAFQTRRLKIANGLPDDLKTQLITEVQNFKVKISKSGNDTYEAWRESIHDDIVLSVSMGCWFLDRMFGPQTIEEVETPTEQEYDPLSF